MRRRPKPNPVESEILQEEGRILHELRKIEHDLHRPVSIQIKFKGDFPMPISLAVGQSVVATPIEKDAAGNLFTFDPTQIAWSTDNTTVASFNASHDGTASFTALAVGTVNVTVTDSANNLSTTDVLTVTAAADTPNTLEISWGTPA